MTRETSIAIRVGVPVVAGLVLLAASLVRCRSGAPKSVVEPVLQPDIVCVEPTAEPVVEPDKPSPPPDIYRYLEECLKAPKWQTPEWGGPIKATPADVRYWVEVEHDPSWYENGSWWLPLSGEGVPDSPSGMYINVPIHGGSDCSGALVN